MVVFWYVYNCIVDVFGIFMFNVFELLLCGWLLLIKCCEDLVLVSIVLVFFVLLMVLVVLVIRFDFKGFVLFWQKCYGYNNWLIWVFKFCLMYMERIDVNVECQIICDDDCIIWVGCFICKISIDELLQLFNVFVGSMLMVGLCFYVIVIKVVGIFFEEVVSEYSLCYWVKFGIIGWVQINGYCGEIDILYKIKKCVEYDFEYIVKWLVWFDFYILFCMVLVVFLIKEVY